jgi:hypothetical protein
MRFMMKTGPWVILMIVLICWETTVSAVLKIKIEVKAEPLCTAALLFRIMLVQV